MIFLARQVLFKFRRLIFSATKAPSRPPISRLDLHPTPRSDQHFLRRSACPQGLCGLQRSVPRVLMNCSYSPKADDGGRQGALVPAIRAETDWRAGLVAVEHSRKVPITIGCVPRQP